MVCGSSLFRELGAGHRLGSAPALGHQTSVGQAKTEPRVRFRIRLGKANWSQILLQGGWARPWGWSRTSASSACFLWSLNATVGVITHPGPSLDRNYCFLSLPFQRNKCSFYPFKLPLSVMFAI